MESMGFIHRATIVDTDDPEQRKRYRVRIDAYHRAELPVESLPWAESCFPFAGKFRGDIPSFDVGDRVIVLLEGNPPDPNLPWLMGGYLAKLLGSPDTPARQTGDYDTQKKRWVRVDSAGNIIEMSPLAEERWIRLGSGGAEAEIIISQVDDTVRLRAGGRVVVEAPRIDATADTITAHTKTLMAEVEDTATIKCDKVLNLQGKDAINLGKYVPPAPATAAKTTKKLSTEIQEEIGVLSHGTISQHSDTDTTESADGKMSHSSKGDMSESTDGAHSTTAKGNLSVETQGNASRTVQGTDTTNVQGPCSVTAQGPIDLLSSATINLTAVGVLSAEASAITVSALSTMTILCPVSIVMVTTALTIIAPTVTIIGDLTVAATVKAKAFINA